MTDIVERLRRERETDHLAIEAATEIERLRAAVAKLGKWNEHTGEWARRALEPKI